MKQYLANDGNTQIIKERRRRRKKYEIKVARTVFKKKAKQDLDKRWYIQIIDERRRKNKKEEYRRMKIKKM